LIVSSKVTIPSARLLRNKIYELTGRRIPLTSNIERVVRKTRRITLRYGNSDELPQGEEWRETTFNSSSDIKFLVNKLTVCNALLEAGFTAPEFKRTVPDETQDFPLIIRRTLTSYKGIGIIPILSREEFIRRWSSGMYWCNYLPVKSEFRFHIYNSGVPKIIRVSKKLPRENIEEEGEIVIRHSDRYYYSLRENPEEKYPKMTRAVLDAARVLPGKFYSLDVGWSLERGTIFFETNTASGLDNGSSLALARALVEDGVLNVSSNTRR